MSRASALLLVAALTTGLLAAAPAGAAPASERRVVQGEVQHLVVELRTGAAVDVTLVVPDAGEAVPVDAEALEDVPAGATVRVVVEEPAAPADPLAVAEVLSLDVTASP
ncbi:MAG: hypothetical protein H5T83_00090, partial [Actinotalea sp.]|nr:hypothetical protein [Actinotalea sp.]